MITTVTLNPAVDKLYLVDDVVLDTVMRVREVHNTAGGKGLNVAKVAALAGEPACAMGFLGGHNGRYLRSLLQERGIKDGFIEVAGETRTCVNIRNCSSGRHTEFLEPGSAVSPQEAQALYERYLEALPDSRAVALSGSAPRGTPEGFYGRMIAAAKARGVPVLLDTSGSLLREGVAAKPTLVKPNADEIGQLLGAPVSGREALLRAAAEIHRGGVDYVVVSLGADGALMVCGDGAFWAKPPQVEAVNTVGCGDSMLAGFAIGLSRGCAPREMLAYASAVAASNARSIETGHISPQEIDSLQAQVQVTALR